jgi:hypothetical protein
MLHTVIALFDTYREAEAARDALVTEGFARDEIALKPRCEPTYANDATSAVTADVANEGVLSEIEHFFEALFVNTPRPHEVAQYAEAVRRGAIMLSADAATDALAELARTVLEHSGAIDIAERAPTWQAPADADAPVWRAPDDATARAHSPLEELGIRRAAARRRGTVRSYRRDLGAPMAAETGGDAAATEATVTAMAAGSAPGMGAVFSAGRSELPGASPDTSAAGATPDATHASHPLPDTGTTYTAWSGSNPGAAAEAAASTPAGAAAPIPDEFLQYEEDHRGGYETKYAGEGSRYDDYASAYRHGATVGRDADVHARHDDEPQARRDWKDAPSQQAWQRIKTAVRHGWERVTHHGHGA